MVLSLGSLTPENTVFSAPLAGYTDLPYRTIAREYGCGLCWSELIMARGLIERNVKTYDLLATADADHPLVVQLGGAEPGIIARAAQLAQDAGADAIDINCGCPAPKMVKRGYGAGLMKDPPKVGVIVEKVRQAVELPVYVKIRAGFSCGRPTACDVAREAESAGADAVAVHGRFREEFFKGISDWDVIAQVKQTVSIPVIGNGDIFSYDDARRMVDQTGCDAVMVGRGSLGKPWLFRNILDQHDSDPSVDEWTAAMDRHIELMLSFYGDKIGCLKLRSMLCNYTKGIPHIRELRPEIIHITDRDDLTRIRAAIVERISMIGQGHHTDTEPRPISD